jgi:hypothetical protein
MIGKCLKHVPNILRSSPPANILRQSINRAQALKDQQIAIHIQREKAELDALVLDNERKELELVLLRRRLREEE